MKPRKFLTVQQALGGGMALLGFILLTGSQVIICALTSINGGVADVVCMPSTNAEAARIMTQLHLEVVGQRIVSMMPMAGGVSTGAGIILLLMPKGRKN